MQQFKTNTNLRTWPTPQDYNEAVQNLHLNAGDTQLQSGQVETSALGLPRPITGAFASVYKVTAGSQKWALRCFLRDIPDTQWRYGRIADYLNQHPLPYTVKFDFQFKGLQIGGRWYPALKMDWVEGETLDSYVAAKIAAGGLPAELGESFKTMCADLEKLGIAHGDLQHGNIMVNDGKLFLVDYDGMFVPHINAPHSNELGHRNYQHPQRAAQHFGGYLDNFSAWVIYTSLYALSVDETLFAQLGAGEDCLLFRKEDFTNPLSSCAFATLESHKDEMVRKLARFLRAQLSVPIEKIPSLSSGLQDVGSLPPLKPDAPRSRNDALKQVAHVPVANFYHEADMWDGPDAKEYIAEAEYAARHAQPQHPVYVSPLHEEPGPLTIPRVLFKPAPRQVKLNETCGPFNPVLFQCLLLLVPPLVHWFLFRSTGSSLGGDHLGLGALMIALPLMLVASLIIWWQPYKDYRIVKFGTAARGRVTDRSVKHWMSGRSSRDQSPSIKHKCEVTYQYPRAVKGKIENTLVTIEVPDDHLRNLADNEEIVVMYLPDGQSLIYKFSWFQAS